jgi:hypothetical protein
MTWSRVRVSFVGKMDDDGAVGEARQACVVQDTNAGTHAR